MQKFDKHELKNGMVIVAEPMENVQSAAFDIMIPSGTSRLPHGCCGAGSVIEDWIFRGAAGKTSRQLGDELDSLGLHRASSLGNSHLTIGAVMEWQKLPEALKLYADVIRQPNLQDEQFEPARQLAIDAVEAMNDNPREKVMVELREKFYPDPLGRNPTGRKEDLSNLSPDQTRQIIKDNFNLSGTILAVAGKYDFEKLCENVEKLFESERKAPPPAIQLAGPGPEYTHIDYGGAQVHIGLMTAAPKPAEENYYNARMAVAVLSGGMSGRLFTEVREKRGLCYAVAARYHGMKQAAGIYCYAGTVPDSAQQTADVAIEQFKNLAQGISEQEIQRAKIGLKSALVMQSESSGARASAIGTDYYILGRIRPLEEITREIDKINADSLAGYLRQNRFDKFTAVTIGPQGIDI
jgi:predicted Zn-dependent peptidase